MKTLKFINTIGIILTLFISSCAENNIPNNTNSIAKENIHSLSLKPIKVDQIEISAEDANKIALSHMKKHFQKDRTPTTISSRTEDNTIVANSTGSQLAHIVNFQEGGYCIISASKKNIPILAYSDNGSFINEAENNIGLQIWKEEIEAQFNNYENLSASEIAWINRKWMEYEENATEYSSRSNPDMSAAFNQEMALYNASTGRTAYPLNIAQNYLPAERYQHFKSIASSKNSPEEYTIIEIIDNSISRNVGPLLTTEWYQRYPLNSKSNIEKVGCFPIAGCQIIAFHQYPTTGYNWNNMKYENYLLYDDAAELIADFRTAANAGNNYLLTKEEFIMAMNSFGYTTIMEEHNNTSLYSYILDYKKPVCLLGYATDPFIGALEDGHAWVCDGATYWEEKYGYKINWITLKNGEYVYETDNIIYNKNEIPLIRLHHNWGNGPFTGNGWYYSDVTQAEGSSYDFKYGRKNFFITPND